MTGITHMVVSASIYSTGVLPRPAALAAAFASHFILDAIPHYELTLNTNLILVAAAGLFIAYISFLRKDIYISAAALLGLLPDLIWVFNLNSAVINIHNYFHFKKTYPIPLTFLLIELAILILFLVILVKSRPLGRKVIDN